LTLPGRPAGTVSIGKVAIGKVAVGTVAMLSSVVLLATACSGGSSSAPAHAAPGTNAVVVNHAAYKYAGARGLVWYVLPPRGRQRSCHPSCSAQLVRPAFRAPAIASVDIVPAQHHRWRLIIQLRRTSMVSLAKATRRHPRGSEIVIAVGSHFLVHAPLRLPIVNGVWQISGLSHGSALQVARVLRSIAHGYAKPARHHTSRQRQHRQGHHRLHRHHRSRHRHHHRTRRHHRARRHHHG